MSVYLAAVLAVPLIISILLGLIAVKKAFFNMRILSGLIALTGGAVAISLLFPAVLGRLFTVGGFRSGWVLAASAFLCILLAYLASIILEYMLSGRITAAFEWLKDFTFGASLKPSLIAQRGRSASITPDSQNQSASDTEIPRPSDAGAVINEEDQTEGVALNDVSPAEETEKAENAESAGMVGFVADVSPEVEDKFDEQIDIEGIITAFMQRDTSAGFYGIAQDGGAGDAGHGEEAAAMEIDDLTAEDIAVLEKVPDEPEKEADAVYAVAEEDSGQAVEGISSDGDEAAESSDDNAIVEEAVSLETEELAAEDIIVMEGVPAKPEEKAEAAYAEYSAQASEDISSEKNESTGGLQSDEELPAHLVEELEGNILEKSVDSGQNIDTMGIETLDDGIAVEKTAGNNKAAGSKALTASLGNTDDLVPDRLKGEQYADIAFRLKEKGDIEGAVHSYMRALDMKPDSSLVFWIVLDMCAIYKSIGQNELARDILTSYADAYSEVMDEGIMKEIERNLI